MPKFMKFSLAVRLGFIAEARSRGGLARDLPTVGSRPR
jgi:hypothetical protein